MTTCSHLTGWLLVRVPQQLSPKINVNSGPSSKFIAITNFPKILSFKLASSAQLSWTVEVLSTSKKGQSRGGHK